MDKDSIIGIAVIIVIALIAINYFHIDCSSLTEKGSNVNPSYEEPDRTNVTGSGWLPPPSIDAEEAGTGKGGGGGDEGEKPGEHGPWEPPSPTPPGPPGPPGP